MSEDEVNEEDLNDENNEAEELDDDELEDDDEFEDEETTRDLVVPGEVLTTDVKNFLPGRGTLLTKDRTKIISLNIGLKQTKKNYINVIPLRGFYTARPGDKVIALVVDKNPVKYRCDINASEDAILKPKNTRSTSPTLITKSPLITAPFSKTLSRASTKATLLLFVCIIPIL